ncbi:amidohydrolase 3 [Tilletiaria anomala UBC 951]|uniref:Amidohydrolase 3 n=1 Tax=Tilletiaria anomala (strain ATCC 24038 / CBS 436.72 / UBC 951) TaxID=1037660 RepID=A0A066VM72_TILAU|nr:amidohydrolase 3 [Tilletiaria anomala UBC 951]KDN39829.1 amidohydrolase 3 [Tilletiaria anomala UBC 951]
MALSHQNATVTSLLRNAEVYNACSNAGSPCNLRVLAPGQAIYPGFHDAHGHVLELGWSLSVANLVGCESKDCIMKRLETYVETLSVSSEAGVASGWIEGLGWDQTRWSPAIFPTASDFSNSPVLKYLKVVLRRVDVHALWVSPAVLDQLHAQGKLPAAEEHGGKVDGGLIVRDENGHPTGIFVDKAMEIVYSAMPAWTDTHRAQYLSLATERLLSVGITNAGDAAVDPASVAFFREKDAARDLGLRFYAFYDCSRPPAKGGKHVCETIAPHIPSHGGRLTARTIKLFADGALGSWGSAMWEEYSDRPGEKGLLLMKEAEIKPTIQNWMQRGFQVGVHCIGDRANTLVLDAYESILSDMNGTDHRPRIEHAQLLRQSDISRFSKLGVIASQQPVHCTSDMGYVESRLGKGSERARGAYPWRSLLGHGARIALGSDFPVELPDVLHGFYSAITRAWPDGSSPAGANEGWHENETLSRGQALRGFTIDAAYAQFEEQSAGTLTPGKRADFVILDTDIMDPTIPTVQVRNAKTLATIIDAATAWKRTPAH